MGGYRYRVGGSFRLVAAVQLSEASDYCNPK